MANDAALDVPDESHPRRWAILWIMCVALILVVAGVSSLNVAIPSIINDLQPSSTETLWIVDSYALVFAGLLLPAGAIGDRYGRKGALLTGLAILSAGAVWASTANTPMTLIAARSLMGVGAAFVMPATLSIIVSVFSSAERSKAIAIWTGFAGAGGAIGIVGGGALLEAFWWGSVFFINIPIAAITLALVAALVPTSRDADQQSLDLVGSVLSIAGLGALVYAIIEGGDAGWTHSTTLLAFGAAVGLLTAFVAFELRTPHPMLDPRLFRHLPFGLSALTITIAFAVMFGMFFIITQFFQFAQGHSPLVAGLRSLPFAVAMIIVAPRSPALVKKIGARAAIVLGFAIQAVGFAILAVMEADTAYAITVVGIVLMAAGLSILMPVASEAIVSSLPANKAGVGSAVNDTTREVGGALGLAAMGSLLASSYRSEIEPLTAGLPPEAAELAQSSIGGALQVASQTNNQVLVEASQQAFVDGMSMAFGIAAGIGAAAALLMAFTYPTSADKLASSTVREPTQDEPSRR